MEPRDQAIAVQTFETDVEISRKTSFGIPVAHDPRHFGGDPVPEVIPELALASALGRILGHTEIESRRRTHHQGNRQRP